MGEEEGETGFGMCRRRRAAAQECAGCVPGAARTFARRAGARRGSGGRKERDGEAGEGDVGTGWGGCHDADVIA